MYGIQNAVSGASPVAVGVIALMLEVNPNLRPGQVKQILQQTARSDSYTGTVPNERWGYGKLDALGAIQATQATVSNEIPLSQGIKAWPNPVKDWLYISSEHVHGQRAEIGIFSLSGKKVADFSVNEDQNRIDLSRLNAGVYFMRMDAGEASGWTKFVKAQ
ncbi:MAG: T9SS type A sorting domain-containing protein [Bacteroidia bacterium]